MVTIDLSETNALLKLLVDNHTKLIAANEKSAAATKKYREEASRSSDDVNKLSSALSVLKDASASTASGLEKYGRMAGRAGEGSNKIWTIFARLSSGSWAWKLQARIRSVSNVFELYYKGQDEGMEARINDIKTITNLASAYEDLGNIHAKFQDKDSGEYKDTDLFKGLMMGLKDENAAFKQGSKFINDVYENFNDRIKKQTKAMKMEAELTDPWYIEYYNKMMDSFDESGMVIEDTTKRYVGVFGDLGKAMLGIPFKPFGTGMQILSKILESNLTFLEKTLTTLKGGAIQKLGDIKTKFFSSAEPSQRKSMWESRKRINEGIKADSKAKGLKFGEKHGSKTQVRKWAERDNFTEGIKDILNDTFGDVLKGFKNRKLNRMFRKDLKDIRKGKKKSPLEGGLHTPTPFGKKMGKGIKSFLFGDKVLEESLGEGKLFKKAKEKKEGEKGMLSKIKDIGLKDVFHEFNNTFRDQFKLIGETFSTLGIFKDKEGNKKWQDKDWNLKSKLGKMQGKVLGKLKGFNFRTIMGFFSKGLMVLAGGLMWGTAVVIGILLVVAVVKKAWPLMSKWLSYVNEKFKFGEVFMAGIWDILEGIIMVLQGLWEGDLAKVFYGIWGKIFPGILKMAYGAIGVLVAFLVGIVPVIIGGMIQAAHHIAVTTARTIKDAIWPFQSGGVTKGGLSLVGEKGPELVSLPKGSRVHSNAQSQRMAGGNTINVHVNGRVGASDAEIRDIANKVAREINLRMNRTGTATMGA